MEIEFRDQKLEFTVSVDNIFFRIKFERKGKSLPWLVEIFDILKEQVVYLSKLESNINPDVGFAEDIIRTFVQQGQSGDKSKDSQ